MHRRKCADCPRIVLEMINFRPSVRKFSPPISPLFTISDICCDFNLKTFIAEWDKLDMIQRYNFICNCASHNWLASNHLEHKSNTCSFITFYLIKIIQLNAVFSKRWDHMQKHYRSRVSIIQKISSDINDKIFLYPSISFNLNISSKNIILCNRGLTPKN